MPSFDVVSKTDLMEVDNAVNGVKRQIKQRFDLAGTKCDVERNENSLTITADDNMKLNQLHDLLRQNLASRKVDAKALDFGKPENASGDSLRQQVMIKQGIDQDLARKINKAVKGSKMKVQITIKGSELHVSGKKRDELQETITFIKNMDTDQPLQYVNFRD
ncbi:MAG: YajQ family cyclic di-GMP-binding protein [Chloroflexi bacterium]|nr:YajQ family cyclic di-GMP-binding protein [Chloroflexota bacterium]